VQIDQAIAELQDRIRRPRVTNLVYLVFPVAYIPADPAHQVSEALGADWISVMGLLVQRFGKRWERLLSVQQPDQLDTVARALAQDLEGRVKETAAAVVGDTEVLYTFPQLNPTALFYPLSGERVIMVSVKASRVAAGLRLLEDGPVYPVDNCTVLEIVA